VASHSRVLAIVPARGDSTRVARKNLAVLGGRTLVRRALETTLAAGVFAAVALSSEDDEILSEAAGLDALAIRRPSELAAAEARTYDVAVHALRQLDPGEDRYDAIAVVQCTSPFTAPEDLAGAVALLERSGADSVVTVAQVAAALHPLKLKILEGDRLRPYLDDDRLRPSHELPPLWVRNGSLYASKVSVLAGGELLGSDVRGYEMPQTRSFDIDTPRDLAFAQFLLAQGTSGAPG
jgi:CMP-N-acetylneuraminic acid synthetase